MWRRPTLYCTVTGRECCDEERWLIDYTSISGDGAEVYVHLSTIQIGKRLGTWYVLAQQTVTLRQLGQPVNLVSWNSICFTSTCPVARTLGWQSRLLWERTLKFCSPYDQICDFDIKYMITSTMWRQGCKLTRRLSQWSWVREESFYFLQKPNTRCLGWQVNAGQVVLAGPPWLPLHLQAKSWQKLKSCNALTATRIRKA